MYSNNFEVLRKNWSLKKLSYLITASIVFMPLKKLIKKVVISIYNHNWNINIPYFLALLLKIHLWIKCCNVYLLVSNREQ